MAQRWSTEGEGPQAGNSVIQWLAQKTQSGSGAGGTGGSSGVGGKGEERGAIAWLAAQTQTGKLTAGVGVIGSTAGVAGDDKTSGKGKSASNGSSIPIPQPRSGGTTTATATAPTASSGLPVPRSQKQQASTESVPPPATASSISVPQPRSAQQQQQPGLGLQTQPPQYAAEPMMVVASTEQQVPAQQQFTPYPSRAQVQPVQIQVPPQGFAMMPGMPPGMGMPVMPMLYVPTPQPSVEALGQLQPYPQPQQQQQQSRKPRRDQGQGARQQNEQQNRRRAEQLKAQELAFQQQQQQLESDPQYRQWYEEQCAQAMQGDAVRNRVFSHLAQQDSLAQVEDQQLRSQKEKLNIGEVLRLISEHDVTIICTDTGSGKSTLIPSNLLDTIGSSARIACTQPRRTATVALAQHVTRTRGEVCGEDIGYWIRGDKRGHEDSTRLWYMTSYTLLLHLLKDPLNPPFTHIILDEFHERQPDLEVTAAILRLVLRHRTANFKLVLMSATLNTEDWESYFEGLSVAVYKQSEPEHPIHDFFLADACAITGVQYNRSSAFSPVLVDQTILEKSLFVAQQLITFLNAVAQPHHSILIFLPGRAQVEHFVMWASNTLRNRIDPIPWHSSVDLSQIQSAINRRGQKIQKLYIATDIAEVSITLPDVVFVIDLGLVKRPLITPTEPATVLYPPLLTQWVSKVNIAQRRGRVGRVQQGFYFCLVPAETIPQLPDFPPSPIQHSRIDELALHSLQVVSNPVALFGLCRGQPQLETIATTMRTLTSLGCILRETDDFAEKESVKEVHDNEKWSEFIMRDASALVGADIEGYRTTFIGRLMQLIPVSTQQGMLVFYGFLTGLESLMILAAAVTNSVSPFDVRMASQNQRKGGKGRNFGGGYESTARAMERTESTMKETSMNLSSDVVSVMGAVLRCRVQCAGHEDDPAFVRIWCEDRCMSYDKTMAIIELDSHIKYELAGFIPFRDVDSPAALLQQLEKCAPIVVAATCGAFASQALEVTIEGNFQHSSKETGVGLFTDLKGMPDLHSPSCIRWELGDVIVPVAVNLRFNHMLVSFATAVKTSKEFYLALLLFAYRLKYGAFADEQGSYFEFAVTYSNTTRYIETDAETGALLLEYRRLCNVLCQTMRLQFSHKELTEEEFNTQILAPRSVPPLVQQQRTLTNMLVTTFYGPPHTKMSVVEVQHGGEELDHETLFSFSL